MGAKFEVKVCGVESFIANFADVAVAIARKAVPETFEEIAPILVGVTKARIPQNWLLRKAIVWRKYKEGSWKQYMGVGIEEMRVVRPQARSDVQRRRRRQAKYAKNSPSRYWIFHDIGSPGNSMKGYSPTKALHFLRPAVNVERVIAVAVLTRKIMEIVSKFRPARPALQ